MNPVVIAGQLSKEQLEKSIQEIVNVVDVGMEEVSKAFDPKLTEIEAKFKEAGTKIGTAFKDSFNAALGGSFDQLAAAMEKISSSGGKFINISGGNSGAKDLLSQIEEIEEQIRDLKIKGITTEEDKARLDAMVEKLQKLQKEKERLEQGAKTVGDLDKIIAMEEHRRKKMELDSAELLKQNELLQEQKDYRKEQLSTEEQLAKAAEKEAEAIERAEAKKLKKAQAPYREELSAANTMPAKDIDQMQQKLERLKRAKDAMRSSGLFDEAKLNRAQTSIDNLEKKIEQIRSKRPKSFSEVMGMDESSIDAITRKMRELKKVQINTQDPQQVKAMSDAMTGLKKKQSELLGSNIRLTNSNNALARSFNYIRNRLMYALTIGSVMSFTKQLYSVRSEYELLERSMGVLIDNFRRGSQIFNELNAMALKSPFTLVELGTAAKQLLAYNFAADEVVDTTRRLADISSALGVPMERLVYNLGQIKAQTVLTARDARDFANAGLAIVPMLAKMYTEQKKFGDEIVTTAQVYDMMKKKLVSYEDVIKVINQVTDEGGKFFDFQAKQAETMKVQLANLALAWNNMLNDIGKSNQSALSTPIKLVKQLMIHWREVLKVLYTVIAAYGAYRLAVMRAVIVTKLMAIQSVITDFLKLAFSIRNVSFALAMLQKAIVLNPIGLLASAAAAAVVYFTAFKENIATVAEYTERFGESGGKVVRDVENLYGAINSVSKQSSNYNKVLGELNKILGDFGLMQISESDNLDQINANREKNIQLIKEEIVERERLNNLNAGQEKYEKKIKEIRDEIENSLEQAITTKFLGLGFIDEELQKNAPAIATIVSDIVTNNIDLIADKTGEEFEKGQQKIVEKINDALRKNKALGLSEETIQKSGEWLKALGVWERTSVNILDRAIIKTKEAKEELNRYTNAVNDFADAEIKNAQAGVGFNDRVQQTQNTLMEAANETENFANKIKELIRQYGDKNVIKFLVDVQSKVPAWMLKMPLNNLNVLAAQFAALAKNAQEQGKAGLDVGGTPFTVAQLWERAAQYAEAARQKVEKASNETNERITSNASAALKDYKEALEAVERVQNMVNQGKADQTLLTKKQAEVQTAYNKALDVGVSKKELDEAKNGKNKGGKGNKKDEVLQALRDEIKLVEQLQSHYEKLSKDTNPDEALTTIRQMYGKTIELLNDQLKSYGLPTIDLSLITGKNPQDVLGFFNQVKQALQDTGLTTEERIKEVEGAIEKATLKVKGFNAEIITKSLNSELDRLKDEYELAFEIQANPELGESLAAMFGIVPEALPRTVNEYADKVLMSLNKAFKQRGDDIELPTLRLTDDDLRAFEILAQEKKISQATYDDIVKATKDFREKEKKEQNTRVEDWKKLIEKYGEFEAKVAKIRKDALNERVAFAMQFGDEEQKQQVITLKMQIDAAEDAQEKQKLRDELEKIIADIAGSDSARIDIKMSIDNSELRKIAQSQFEAFQNSPEWVAATGDLATFTDSALAMLINRLEDFKKKAKDLDPKQIHQINNALIKLRKEQRKGNPFAAIANALDEAKQAAQPFLDELQRLEERYVTLKAKQRSGFVVLSEKETKELKELPDKIKAYQEAAEKAGNVSASAIVGSLQEMHQNIGQVTGAIGDMFSAFGNTEAAENIKKITNIFDKAIQGAQIGASFGGYGAAIGGIVGALVGAVTSFADELSGNAGLTRQVEASERSVKRLENAYKDLEHAVENAYGSGKVAIEKYEIANKQAQLAELKRQLKLEKQRSDKNRDQDKILDLEGQIIDLQNEIADKNKEILNDLLGISSVGDAVENIVGNIIEAIRSGENALDSFDESINDMIANMVMKMYASKIIGPWFEDLWNNINQNIEDRTSTYQRDLQQFQSSWADWIEHSGVGAGGFYFDKNGNVVNFAKFYAEKYGISQNEKGFYDPNEIIDVIKGKIEEASKITMQDIEQFAELAKSGQPLVEGQIEELKMLLQRLGLMKDSASEKLSALQQGIQGITEDTAGALEAYMNGVSQQVYLHSQLLTEIRDAVVGFSMDVQLGVQSQILLELQNSYQVQMAIQGILQGWSNPSGSAVKVEMI